MLEVRISNSNTNVPSPVNNNQGFVSFVNDEDDLILKD